MEDRVCVASWRQRVTFFIISLIAFVLIKFIEVMKKNKEEKT